MKGYPIKNVADGITMSRTGFYDQMLFALPDSPQPGAVEKKDPVGDVILRSNGFMTKVEAKAAIAAQRNDPGNDQRGGGERLVGKLIAI